MEALDLIERRINKLENIIGNVPSNNRSGETISDTLSNVGSLLSTATEGHEKLGEMLKRSEELDNYMDPNFIDNHQLLDLKKTYIMAVGDDIMSNVEKYKEIVKLAPVLDSPNLKDLPDITDNLAVLRKDILEQKQSSDFIEESLILAMQRYGEIQKNIMESLIKMNLRIDELESKVKAVKK